MDYAQGIKPENTSNNDNVENLLLLDYCNPNELKMRKGLPNILTRLKAGKCATIAYVGGSITFQKGWRVRSFEWLGGHYPQARMKEVNAAVNGTGSNLAAARLWNDVLNMLRIWYLLNIIGDKHDFAENPEKYRGNVVYLGKILVIGNIIEENGN